VPTLRPVALRLVVSRPRPLPGSQLRRACFGTHTGDM